MRVAEPLRQMLRAPRRKEWPAVAAEYLAQPADWWGPQAPRHATKLERAKQAVAARDGLDLGDVIATVLDVAAKRRMHRPRPVYITGLGGSGSHWLTSMLADATDHLVDAGEVYVPRTVFDELSAMPQLDQACVVDAITVLHGLAKSRDAWALSTINCAAGVRMVPRARAWFPDAVMVHLRRDPRDQVLSVTFRKPQLRSYLAPEATDDEYLGRMIRRSVTAYREHRAAAADIDVDCSYEQLLVDPRPVLRQVIAALGHTVDDDRLDAAVARHDAAAIRAGDVEVASNLDEGGRARPWRELDDPACRRRLHVGLMDVICGYGYEPGDCMGSHVPDPALPARAFSFDQSPPGPLFARTRGEWRRLATRGPVTVDRGVPVMLRLGADDARDLRVLRARGPADLQALCLAGNPNVHDDALPHVAVLTGLQTLDLAATHVSDTGLAHLHGLRRLQQINLAGTPTTPRGRSRLASTLPELTIWT